VPLAVSLRLPGAQWIESRSDRSPEGTRSASRQYPQTRVIVTAPVRHRFWEYHSVKAHPTASPAGSVEEKQTTGDPSRGRWARWQSLSARILKRIERSREALRRLRWNLFVRPNERTITRVKAQKQKQKFAGIRYNEAPRVSVIVQSFNQVRNVGFLATRLRATRMDELIVCEDGSIDGSVDEWLRRLTHPNDFLLRSNDLHEIRTPPRGPSPIFGDCRRSRGGVEDAQRGRNLSRWRNLQAGERSQRQSAVNRTGGKPPRQEAHRHSEGFSANC
jgi:hypothetical protein